MPPPFFFSFATAFNLGGLVQLLRYMYCMVNMRYNRLQTGFQPVRRKEFGERSKQGRRSACRFCFWCANPCFFIYFLGQKKEQQENGKSTNVTNLTCKRSVGPSTLGPFYKDLPKIYFKAVNNQQFNHLDHGTRLWYYGTAASVECLQAPSLNPRSQAIVLK